MQIAAIKRILFLFAFISVWANVYSQNHAVINADLGQTKINKNIYGHFAEHLGNCIYGGFYVGDTNKVIPNTNGVRNDIIEALKN